MTTRSSPRIANPTVSVSSMLKRAVVDANDVPTGRIEDAIIMLRGDQYPLLTGLVVDVAGGPLFIPASAVTNFEAERIRLRVARADMRPFERRDGDVLLKQDVLGHRHIEIDRRDLVKAHDVQLAATEEGWIVVGLVVHKHRWFDFGTHENQRARDWHLFLLLMGTQRSLKSRPTSSWIGRLKPAQIADIIEAASSKEQTLLLGQLHADLELEADVFEELDEDRQTQLLKTRSDTEIAELLSRMRADDVADAVMDLPKGRRRKILDLLPQPQNTKVLTLLGHNAATAGGLMGTDYLALPEEHTIADALLMLRAAITQQPESLTTIHSLHSDGTLAGTLSLVRALQLDPTTLLRDAADPDSVVASPEDDIIAVTTRMADFNLLTLPVLDPSGLIIGIVTVDDALEAAIPWDWSRRGSGRLIPRPRRRKT